MLRKISFLLFIGLLALSCAIAEPRSEGFKIEIQVEGVQDTLAFLAYHYGNRQYVKDTVDIDSHGKFTFQGDESLPAGIYMVVLPGQNYFEILIDDNQHFGVNTNKDNFVENMTFINSPQNESFYEYMHFIGGQNALVRPARQEMQEGASDVRREELRQVIQEVEENVREKQNQLIAQFEGKLLSRILSAQQEAPMPDTLLNADGTPDTAAMYRLFKENFWKNIDFSDDRLIRTPIFHAKLQQYFSNVVIQIPDSLIKEADRIVDKARAHPEVFKYTLFFLTNHFERSQIMGMDAVFVHMVEAYYMTGEADWISEEQLARISERAMALKPILIGKIAPDINMFTPDRQRLRLHDVEAEYIVLYFWDSECGHCKKQTPKFIEFYERMAPKGVEIFAVNTEADREKWINYFTNNELQWIQVHDPTNQSGFRDKYDIWATPLIFLLDSEKRIMAKRLTVEQTEEVILRDMGRQ